MKKDICILIDDDEDDLYILDTTIKSNFPEIKFLGFKHFDTLISSLKEIDHQQIKAIFIDLNMPKTNGLEVLKYLKKERDLEEVPLLIYSTSNNPEDINNTLRAGANAFINKPSKIAEIVQKIKIYLS